MPNEIATMRRTLAPTTFAEAFNFAEQLAKSSMVPAEYRGKPENILLAIQWGQELGIAPLQAIQNIAVINGKPSVYGDTLLALVRGSPVCDDVIESFVGDGDDFAAVCEARRKSKSPVVARFSVADAKAAGLWGKQGPWKQYPRRMLQMRARGFALRDAFPDVLRGVITVEEAADYPVNTHTGRPAEPIDITPRHDLDTFAAAGGGVIDVGTVDAPQNGSPAMLAARGGKEAFRAFWKDLSPDDRAMLRPDMAEYQRIAEEADRERESNEDPFGLSPLAEPAATVADAASADASDPAGEHDDLRVPLASTKPVDLALFARQLVALIEERPGAADEIGAANAAKIAKLNEHAPELHGQVQAALAEKRQPTLV